MKVNQLIANNINKLDTDIPFNKSFGIAGLSFSARRLHLIYVTGEVQ
ncbi:hypothetical protein OB975_11755 [Bacillus cereus]|nr:hypothetical protein [Bacillus cereus]MCU5446242.1 hypothetical protein [Bacillus cereus]MCU5481371.1 hypothetical protein [Bacillus cereus]